MSDTENAGGERVPSPREVWRAAAEGRRITVTVSPEDAAGTVKFSGEITEEPEKDGDAWTTTVTLAFTPDNRLAPVELEARKERGEWGPFRAFNWTQPARPDDPAEHVFRYVGRVVDVSIPNGRWRRDGARERSRDGEVVA